MMTRAIRFVAAASLAAAPPLAAQGAGTVEIGAFARYTDFDNSLAMNNAVGIGGQVSVYLERVVAVELDVSRTSAGRPLGASDGGVSALLGLRYRWSDRLWLRGGLDADFMVHSGSAQGSPFTFYSGNWGLPLGATLRLKGGGGAQP